MDSRNRTAQGIGGARDCAIQSGAATVAAQEQIFDARFPNEGTQEVRTEGRAEALPVHEALAFVVPTRSGPQRTPSRLAGARSRPARSRQEAVLRRESGLEEAPTPSGRSTSQERRRCKQLFH